MTGFRVEYERHGSCEYWRCGAACCRNMFNPSPDTEGLLNPTKGICQYLNQKTNECTLEGVNKPPYCSAFPYINNPFHHNYLKVKGVCSFWFEEIVEEIDDANA